MAAPSMGTVCDLPRGGCAAGNLSGRGWTLRQLLPQNRSSHVAGIGRLRFPHLRSAAGASQGEFKHVNPMNSLTCVCLWLKVLLIRPPQVCVQALIYTVLWRPVDPEVEDLLAQDTTVVRSSGEQGAKVRPPCGYGLLQAKDEARKVRALRSLVRVRAEVNFERISPQASDCVFDHLDLCLLF